MALGKERIHSKGLLDPCHRLASGLFSEANPQASVFLRLGSAHQSYTFSAGPSCWPWRSCRERIKLLGVKMSLEGNCVEKHFKSRTREVQESGIMYSLGHTLAMWTIEQCLGVRGLSLEVWYRDMFGKARNLTMKDVAARTLSLLSQHEACHRPWSHCIKTITAENKVYLES